MDPSLVGQSLIGQNLSLLLLLAGAALVIAEGFAPGAHFIVLGVALLVAGLVGLFLPASLAGSIFAPLLLAGLVLGAGAITFYVYRQYDFYGGKGQDQTSDSDSLRGRTGRVTERVTTTDGEVKLDEGGFNPYYQARSVDGTIEEGSEVMVVDPGGGNVVTVEPIAGGVDEIDRQLARDRRESGADETVDGRDAEADATTDGPAAANGPTDGADETDDASEEFERDTA
jgi:membrane protein implicated in regulation of membrane protease activity